MITNNKFLKEQQSYHNWSNSTFKNYERSVDLYSQFNKMSIQELIEEAEKEEEKNILMKKRSIKKRLNNFKIFLHEKKYKPLSINTYINRIKAIYRYNDITVPRISNEQQKTHETIEDLPTKAQIREAINNTANLKLKSIILFMASSGTARNEATHLTIKDYIRATFEYHKTEDIISALSKMKNKNDIIPTFHLTRLKTNYPYYTFCTPETTEMINKMLMDRLLNEELNQDSLLFGLKNTSVTSSFSRLNDRLQYGWKDTRRLFHAHSLRKYFTSTLFAEEMDFQTIEFLCGHKINATQEAYYKANPNKQKRKYMKYLDKLSILSNYNMNNIEFNEKKELEELRNYKKDTEKRLTELENIVKILLPD